MPNRSTSSNDFSPIKEIIFDSLRRFLRAARFHRSLQVVRLLIHFGPWRGLAKRIIQKTRPPVKPPIESVPSSLPPLDSSRVSLKLKKDSVAVVGTIEKDLLKTLISRTKELPVDHYKLIHHIDADIKRLSEDPEIKSVLRHFFRSEPVLLESTIAITEGDKDNAHSQNSFHFDYAGWESVNIFVYLTDVTELSSYHIVAQGSHRNIRLRDLFRKTLPDSEAQRRFGSRIKPILGEAGTLFFENTEAFHRRQSSSQRRVLLNMLYASHRSCLSHGRTDIKHMHRRTALYQSHKDQSEI